MLSENIKNLRKNKGLTQEELAIRLHVVRQTVSKWEKGQSVPDAVMLQRLAEELDTDVAFLLGFPVETARDNGAIAEQLSRINEQLAIRNRRSKRIWTVVALLVGAWILLHIAAVALSYAAFEDIQNETIVTANEAEVVEK